jgi:hypothetical protein
MSNTLYRVTCGEFTGGFVVDDQDEITTVAPFLMRLKGLNLTEALNDLIHWDGVVIERVSPGRKPNIPEAISGALTRRESRLIS